MPSHNKMPIGCEKNDCINAFESFKSIMTNTKNYKVWGDVSCWEPVITRGNHFATSHNKKTGNVKVQFKIPFKKESKKNYYKIGAHRIWFYSSEANIDYAENHDDYTVSHLCHPPKGKICINHKHLVLEGLAYNQSRNICPGGVNCIHEPKCLKAGGGYTENRTILQWKEESKAMTPLIVNSNSAVVNNT